MACENRLERPQDRLVRAVTPITYEVQIVDEDDEPVPPGRHRARSWCAPEAHMGVVHGVLQAPEDDGGGVAQPLVPHRRPRPDGRGRVPVYFIDRMKDCDPAAGREHLVLGGGVDVNTHPSRARVGGVRRPLRALRGGRDGRRRPPAGDEHLARRRCSTSARARWRTSPCPATSDSWTRCRRTTPSGSRSPSCATRASRTDTWDREEHGYEVAR